MKTAHYATIAGALLLIGVLYWGTNTIPPAKKNNEGQAQQGGKPQSGAMAVRPANFDSLLKATKRRMNEFVVDSIEAIEKEMAPISNNKQLAALNLKLSQIYERNRLASLSTYYLGKSGKLDNSAKTLTFAGQLFLSIMEDEHDASMHSWAANEAVGCLEEASRLQPDSENVKLALATAYIEGAGEPMKGVQILRGIVNEKPNDVPANMLLGRLSIQSAQFDKAVGRFETILKVEPNNTEAIYFLAQAYEGLGNKTKTVELLTRCKELVNKPEFSKEIDEHIKTLK